MSFETHIAILDIYKGTHIAILDIYKEVII